jgi:hypothetical protein
MLEEHSPARRGDSAAGPVYTIDEFCRAHRISRAKLYQLWDAGDGPRVMRVGIKVLITTEAAAEWRASREGEYVAA